MATPAAGAAAPAAAAGAVQALAVGSARARRERRCRAEARLRLALVRDGAALAAHRGGPSPGALGEVVSLRAQVTSLTDQLAALRAEVGRLSRLQPPAAAEAVVRSQSSAAPSLAVGTRCRVVGLVAKAALNGRLGTVLDAAAADGRLAVEADPGKGTVFPDLVMEASCKVRVKAENLEFLVPG